MWAGRLVLDDPCEGSLSGGQQCPHCRAYEPAKPKPRTHDHAAAWVPPITVVRMSGAPRAKKARKLCEACSLSPAVLVRPKTGKRICKACFFKEFEAEIHHTIVANGLFSPGDRVAIAASGGKGETSQSGEKRQRNDCPLPVPARLDCAGACHDQAESGTRIWTGPLPALSGRGHHRVQGRLPRGTRLRLCLVLMPRPQSQPLALAPFACCSDCEAQPAAVRGPIGRGVVQGPVRVDHGRHRRLHRTELQLHFLRCVQAASAGPWSCAGQGRQGGHGPQRR